VPKAGPPAKLINLASAALNLEIRVCDETSILKLFMIPQDPSSFQ